MQQVNQSSLNRGKQFVQTDKKGVDKVQKQEKGFSFLFDSSMTLLDKRITRDCTSVPSCLVAFLSFKKL